MDLPSWVTPDVMTQMKQLKDFGFEFLFGIHRRVEKARLQGGECTKEGALCCSVWILNLTSYLCLPGVLLDHIRKNLTKAANVSAHQQLKLLVYSAVSQRLGTSFGPLTLPHRELGLADGFNPFWLLHSLCSEQEMYLCLWLGGMCHVWHHSSKAFEENS